MMAEYHVDAFDLAVSVAWKDVDFVLSLLNDASSIATWYIVRCVLEVILITCMQPGRSIETTLFLDVVGLVGYYLAVSETFDLLSHNSSAPCPFCMLSRYDRSGRGASRSPRLSSA